VEWWWSRAVENAGWQGLGWHETEKSDLVDMALLVISTAGIVVGCLDCLQELGVGQGMAEEESGGSRQIIDSDI
jgi:hypothetical protein